MCHSNGVAQKCSPARAVQCTLPEGLSAGYRTSNYPAHHAREQGVSPMTGNLRGKDMITTQEWSKSELTTVLDVADRLKAEFAAERWDHFSSLPGR